MGEEGKESIFQRRILVMKMKVKIAIIIMFSLARQLFYFSQTARLFVFAGQGTQQKGMLSSLNQQRLHHANEISKRIINIDLAEVAKTDTQNIINQTQVTQPLLLLSHCLHFQQQFASSLSQHDYMIGHSLGQFSALVNAGSLSLQQGLTLVHQRGLLMKKHTTLPHGMLIIKYKLEKQAIILEEIKKSQLEIACINSRTSIIVAGLKDKIGQLSKQLKKHQIVSMNLPVSTAFHCKMLEAMKEEFHSILSKTHFQSPKCQIVRNYDCKTYQNSSDIREGLLHQLTNPVLFYQSVQSLSKTIPFYEIGHKKWISKFVEESRPDL